MVSTADAAELLTVSTSALTGWARDNTGPIKPVRIGRLLRWRVSDIAAVLAGDAA